MGKRLKLHMLLLWLQSTHSSTAQWCFCGPVRGQNARSIYAAPAIKITMSCRKHRDYCCRQRLIAPVIITGKRRLLNISEPSSFVLQCLITQSLLKMNSAVFWFYLSCGTILATGPLLSLFGKGDILLVHTLVGSCWTVLLRSRLPVKSQQQKNNLLSETSPGAHNKTLIKAMWPPPPTSMHNKALFFLK